MPGRTPRRCVRAGAPTGDDEALGFPTTASLGLVGHGFLLFVFLNPEWSTPPWPGLGALLVMTLAASTTALFVRRGILHAAAHDRGGRDHLGVGAALARRRMGLRRDDHG